MHLKKLLARKKLRETIADSHQLRRQHLSDLALALELNGDFKNGKVIKQLITIEYQRRFHSTIKHHFKPINKSNLSIIEIPINATDWNNIPKYDSVQWKTESNSTVSAKLLIKKMFNTYTKPKDQYLP